MNNLELTVHDDLLPDFNILLQQGFFLKTDVGISVRDLLRNECRRNDEYLRGRIKTVFLDFKAVDDIDGAIIKDGSTLSISGAMPGLVGALMRTGSHMASMRSAITYEEDSSGIYEIKRGMVKIKLFNLILVDLGAEFLSRGIFVLSENFRKFFLDKYNAHMDNCKDIKLNGEHLSADLLREKILHHEEKYIFIKVNL